MTGENSTLKRQNQKGRAREREEGRKTRRRQRSLTRKRRTRRGRGGKGRQEGSQRGDGREVEYVVFCLVHWLNLRSEFTTPLPQYKIQVGCYLSCHSDNIKTLLKMV